jgi:predicted RNase H-related nuclease YkuK (DUF458 family)
MKNFKQFGGFIIEDLQQYVKDYIRKNPHVEIYVGSDSQNNRKSTRFVTVICFVHPGHGGHIIFKRYTDTRIKVKKEDYDRAKSNSVQDKFWKKTLFPRMWKEVQDSAETAIEIKDVIDNKMITVDLDLNPLEKHQSNIAHDAGVGYIKSLGFQCRTKPHAWAASAAADMLCK